MTSKQLIIGSRASDLAIAQTQFIIQLLTAQAPDLNYVVKEFITKGDKILDKSLGQIGSKGLFTYELEESLLAGNIDLAVHSLKDLPTSSHIDLPIISIISGEDNRDCLVQLKSNIQQEKDLIIGTSSIRRQGLIKQIYPQAKTTSLRGNIRTRLGKLKNQEKGINACILAMAGLNRLQSFANYSLDEFQITPLDPYKFIPAPGQGALAMQANLSTSHKYQDIFDNLNRQYLQSNHLINIERQALQDINGGCSVEFGAFAEYTNSKTVRLYTFHNGIYNTQNIKN